MAVPIRGRLRSAGACALAQAEWPDWVIAPNTPEAQPIARAKVSAFAPSPKGAAILRLCNSIEIPYIGVIVNNRKEVIQCLIVFRRGRRRR